MNRLVKHVEKPQGNFTAIPNNLIEGMGELSLLAKMLYFYLLSRFEGKYNPSVKGLSHRIYNRGSPVGYETVKRALKELETAGWIEKKKTGFNSYTWHIYDRPYHNNDS